MYIILYHEIENIWFFNMYSSNKEWSYKFFNLILMRFFINVKREWINRLMEFIYNSLKRIYIFSFWMLSHLFIADDWFIINIKDKRNISTYAITIFNNNNILIQNI